MDAVGEGEPLAIGAGELRHQRRTVAAGLLVGPLAAEEHRYLDLIDEGDRRQRVGNLCPVVVVAAGLGDQVDRLGMQVLVLLADLIAVLDPLPGPLLAGGRARRLRVVDAILRPPEREAGVQDPARIERRQGVVDHRQRRDRREARRLGRADEQLADAAIGDADHADLAAEHPGLAGDRLDHVVAVERLQGLEVVEGTARAARAAHVDVNDRIAEQAGNRSDPALGAGRVGVAVAGVLDDRRIGAVLGRSGKVDGEGELGPVPGLHDSRSRPREASGRRSPCSAASSDR